VKRPMSLPTVSLVNLLAGSQASASAVFSLPNLLAGRVWFRSFFRICDTDGLGAAVLKSLDDTATASTDHRLQRSA